MSTTHTNTAEIRVGGKTLFVPGCSIGQLTVIVTGKWLKVAHIKDEDLVEHQFLDDPETLITTMKQRGIKADLFTFAQKVPDTTPKFSHHVEWDNSAVVPITTHKEWLEKRVEYDVRKAIKKATKLGVTARTVEFSDDLVRAIEVIYNESTTRQGKAFWHYGKDFETVKREAGTYLERSVFIGAYFQDELIGFVKMAYVGKIASTIHVISMKKHFDKKVTNLLLSKTIEICEQKGVSHLTYGQYIYNDPASSLTEFKRRNGFEKALLPRYYAPLTAKGRVILGLGLHHGIMGLVPKSVVAFLLRVRAEASKRLSKLSRVGVESAPSEAPVKE